MIDYLEDSEGDLLFVNGDLARGESNQQQQRKLLMSEPGEYKMAPTATIGLNRYLNDDSPAELLRDIRLKFAADGMQVERLGFEGDKLQIVADYAS